MPPKMHTEALDLLDEPVMMIVAARGRDGLPALGRAVGARNLRDEGLIDLFVSRGQWPEFVEALGPGAVIALTCSRPSDYHTFQVKGTVQDLIQADAEATFRAKAYQSAITETLLGLGVGIELIRCWLTTEDLSCVRFAPERAYLQTPGPRAGRPLASASP